MVSPVDCFSKMGALFGRYSVRGRTPGITGLLGHAGGSKEVRHRLTYN